MFIVISEDFTGKFIEIKNKKRSEVNMEKFFLGREEISLVMTSEFNLTF